MERGARAEGVPRGNERSFDEVKDELRDRILAEKATDLIYDRANKLDNLLASGNTLDQLPTSRPGGGHRNVGCAG